MPTKLAPLEACLFILTLIICIIMIIPLYLHPKQLILSPMRTYFCIKVEIPTNQIKSPYKTVYERILDIDDSISIPYESLLTSMRMLYGSNCQISFSIHNYV